MAERLGLGVIPGVGWSAHEVQTIARQAEEAGFDAIFVAEVNNDVMAGATDGDGHDPDHGSHMDCNIYLRHPYVCAQGAAFIADATDGRFLLGLGVSHQPVNRALGIDMPEPQATLRRYVTMRSWLRGKGQPHTSRSDQRPIPCRSMWRRWPHPRSSLGVSWLMASCPFCGPPPGSPRARGGPPVAGPKRPPWPPRSPWSTDFYWRESWTLCATQRAQNLALFTTFPFFQRLFRAMGYADEAALMERGVEPGCADRPAPGCGLPARTCHALPGTGSKAFRAAGVPISRSSCQRWELRRHERSSRPSGARCQSDSRPNNGLQATAASVRSCVAPASGSGPGPV